MALGTKRLELDRVDTCVRSCVDHLFRQIEIMIVVGTNFRDDKTGLTIPDPTPRGQLESEHRIHLNSSVCNFPQH